MAIVESGRARRGATGRRRGGAAPVSGADCGAAPVGERAVEARGAWTHLPSGAASPDHAGEDPPPTTGPSVALEERGEWSHQRDAHRLRDVERGEEPRRPPARALHSIDREEESHRPRAGDLRDVEEGEWSADGVAGFAREHGGDWDGASGAEDADRGVERVMADLTVAVEEVVATDLDALGEPEIKQQLQLLQREMNRLAAFRSRCAGTLESRAIRDAGHGRESAAVRPIRDWEKEELRLDPFEAKRTGQTGRRVAEDPDVERAYAGGRIREEHVRVITDAIRQLTGAQREEVLAALLEAAETCTPIALGRLARRLLAEADHEAAQAADDRRHGRRYGRMTETADGMLALHALLAGLDKEVVQTAIDAFRTTDAHGEHRTSEQRTADALVAALRASLDLGEAPTQHGIQPHVIVIVKLDDYVSGRGTGEGMWSGPIPVDEIRRLSHDATITRVLVDARSVPIEASEGRRNVASGVWKTLLARDRGCRWPGCQAPPAWCDAAHGRDPYRDKGRLSPSNGVLLCRRHHRKVDNGRWTIDIRGPDITFIAPDGRRVESPPPG